ncbi:hypothetical protein D5S17_12945 [Pseudonocardiaceae bacterium YIM PH 21723]|nr:hypothetical protein D5S17_12945 [Pseudonocardiaceae bacterium YIM PH 21723]
MNEIPRLLSEAELDRALADLHAGRSTGEDGLPELRARLMAQIKGEDPMAKKTKRYWFAAAAAVAVLVTGALLAQTSSIGGSKPVASAAAAVLNGAANITTGANDEPIKPGQFRYTKTHAWWMASGDFSKGDPYAFRAENLLQQWVPTTESDDWLWRRAVTGNREWVIGTEEKGQAAGILKTPGWPTGEWKEPYGDWWATEKNRPAKPQEPRWAWPTPAFQDSLPKDPQAMFDRLRKDTAGKGRTPDAEMLVYAKDALITGLVRADVRATLYRALAMVPGLTVTEGVVTLDGRSGTALGISDGDQRQEIVIDPKTGAFIGDRSVAESGTYVPKGTVTTTTSVESAVVDKLGQVPGK